MGLIHVSVLRLLLTRSLASLVGSERLLFLHHLLLLLRLLRLLLLLLILVVYIRLSPSPSPVAGRAGAGVAHMRVSAASKRSCQTTQHARFRPGALRFRQPLRSAVAGIGAGGGTRELRVLEAVLVACVFVESWNAMRCDA